MNRRLDRRLLALAAAYAVFLDTPLPGFHRHFATGGEIGPAVICSAGGPGSAADDSAPEKPQPCCP
jgi:hypothetical protein